MDKGSQGGAVSQGRYASYGDAANVSEGVRELRIEGFGSVKTTELC